MRHLLRTFFGSPSWPLGSLLIYAGVLAALGWLWLLVVPGVGLWVGWWASAWRERRHRGEALEVALLAIENRARALRHTTLSGSPQAVSALFAAIGDAVCMGAEEPAIDARLRAGGLHPAPLDAHECWQRPADDAEGWN